MHVHTHTHIHTCLHTHTYTHACHICTCVDPAMDDRSAHTLSKGGKTIAGCTPWCFFFFFLIHGKTLSFKNSQSSTIESLLPPAPPIRTQPASLVVQEPSALPSSKKLWPHIFMQRSYKTCPILIRRI